MAIPALETPLRPAAVAPGEPDGAQAATVARIERELRSCFEHVVERTPSDQVEVGNFLAAFLTLQTRENRARYRRHVTEATFATALLETFDIETRDGRSYLRLKPPRPEGSRPDDRDDLYGNRGPRRSRRRVHRIPMRTQERLPLNKDQVVRVTECSRDEVGRIRFNFHLKIHEQEMHYIIQHLNSVKLKKCNQYSEGFICAALYADLIEEIEYQNFARARVLGPGREENCVRVRFLDFNFEDEVKKTWLRQLPKRLRRIPPLAYRAVVVNTDVRYPAETESQAARMLSSEMTIVRVLRYQEENDCYETYLYRPNERCIDDLGFQVG